MEAIKHAISLVGGATNLAKSLNVSPQMVSQWQSGKRPVSIEKCTQIEIATSGAVTRKDLRPDDWHLIWPELASVA